MRLYLAARACCKVGHRQWTSRGEEPIGIVNDDVKKRKKCLLKTDVY